MKTGRVFGPIKAEPKGVERRWRLPGKSQRSSRSSNRGRAFLYTVRGTGRGSEGGSVLRLARHWARPGVGGEARAALGRWARRARLGQRRPRGRFPSGAWLLLGGRLG